MIRRFANSGALALALTLPLAACDDGLAGLGDRGEMRVQLSRASGSGSSAVAANLVAASLGDVPLSAVQSIDVTLSSIQAHYGEEESEDGGWVELELSSETTIDLLLLPEEEENGVELASSELEAGLYSNIRLFFSEATVTFAEEVSLGGGPSQVTYEPGQPYPLFIPSGAQTGIKIPLGGFEVPEGGSATVSLVFDASTSVQNVVVTGTGILMTPVLHVDQD